MTVSHGVISPDSLLRHSSTSSTVTFEYYGLLGRGAVSLGKSFLDCLTLQMYCLTVKTKFLLTILHNVGKHSPKDTTSHPRTSNLALSLSFLPSLQETKSNTHTSKPADNTASMNSLKADYGVLTCGSQFSVWKYSHGCTYGREIYSVVC
jgi:hypothetical protein